MAHATTKDPNVFILPDLGEGVHEAELIKWRVKPGDTVAEHDILAEMETDKALVEVPSPRSGKILTLHGSEGETLHVGNPLVSYEGAGSAQAGPAPARAAAPVAASALAPATQDNGHRDNIHDDIHDDIPEPGARTEDAGTVVGKMGGPAAGVSAAPGKALATPAVRRLARDLGVDIDALQGTGIGCRVVEKDVRAAAARGTAPSSNSQSASSQSASTKSSGANVSPASPRSSSSPARVPVAAPDFSQARASTSAAPDSITRISFRGVRRTIANRLRESVNRAVHFNVMDEADVSALDSLRKKLAAASGEKVSFLPFVASAICRVLSKSDFRAMNATVEENPENPKDEPAILQHRAVNLGIATDTDTGLMVPVIRDADGLGVLEISRHIASIASAARNRSISREQLMGSTFTISNVGSHAGRFATPIINYPEVAILAVGRARQAPVIRHGGIFVGNLLPLSLACDHRVVDGATAALALAEIIAMLQDPEQLLGPARG